MPTTATTTTIVPRDKRLPLLVRQVLFARDDDDDDTRAGRDTRVARRVVSKPIINCAAATAVGQQEV